MFQTLHNPRFIFILAFTLITGYNCPAQNPAVNEFMLPNRDYFKNFQNKNEINFTQFPFQLGFEGGPTIKIKEKNFFEFGFWAFLKLNLYKKIVFLRSECGSLGLHKDLGNNAFYFFIGNAIDPIKIKQHSVSINFGLAYYGSKDQKSISLSSGLEYLFKLYKEISVIAGIKYPIIKSSRYNEFYYNPIFTIGLQLF